MIQFESEATPMRTTSERGEGVTEIRDHALAKAMYAAFLHAKNAGEIQAVIIDMGSYFQISIKDSPTTVNLFGVKDLYEIPK